MTDRIADLAAATRVRSELERRPGEWHAFQELAQATGLEFAAVLPALEHLERLNDVELDVEPRFSRARLVRARADVAERRELEETVDRLDPGVSRAPRTPAEVQELEAARRRLAELAAEEVDAADAAERARIVAGLEEGTPEPLVDLAAAGLEARPLAELARQRLRRLVEGMAEPLPADELRDAAIGVAALTSALEELEAIDGRAVVHRAVVERWADAVAELLELVGEPPERGEAGRVWWSVREGVLDELDDVARRRPFEESRLGRRRELDAGGGGGLWARAERAEDQRDAVRAELDGVRRASLEDLKRNLDERRRHFAHELGDLQTLVRQGGTRPMLEALERLEATFHSSAVMPELGDVDPAA